jgi:hypothetical protein
MFSGFRISTMYDVKTWKRAFLRVQYPTQDGNFTQQMHYYHLPLHKSSSLAIIYKGPLYKSIRSL